MHEKSVLLFYLNLNLKHKILIKWNLRYTKPFMRDQSSLFRRKAYLLLTFSLHLQKFNFIENFKPHMTSQNDALLDRIYC